MNNDTITLTGVIEFDPKSYTKKHESQASWKRVAMVRFSGDVCAYYAWFIKNRYNLKLTKPLRNAHITFVNDRESDTNGCWDAVRAKWDSKKIEVKVDISPRTNGSHWWLVIPEDCRGELHSIRAEMGLNRPYFGLHLTIGYACNSYNETEGNAVKAMEMSEEHSKYIHGLIIKELI
jgi:hypothetical protein